MLVHSRDIIAAFLISASVAAAGVTAVSFFIERKRQTAFVGAVSSAELAVIRSQIETLKRDLYSEGAPVAAVDEGRIVRLEDDFKAIRQILSNNVERALAVPLLRQDVERLEKQTTSEVASLQKDIDRLYNAVVWLIGIFITTALAVLGLFISRRKAD